MKKKHLFNAALLWAFLSLTLWTTGCSDDDGYPDVDGQAPSIEKIGRASCRERV